MFFPIIFVIGAIAAVSYDRPCLAICCVVLVIGWLIRELFFERDNRMVLERKRSELIHKTNKAIVDGLVEIPALYNIRYGRKVLLSHFPHQPDARPLESKEVAYWIADADNPELHAVHVIVKWNPDKEGRLAIQTQTKDGRMSTIEYGLIAGLTAVIPTASEAAHNYVREHVSMI